MMDILFLLASAMLRDDMPRLQRRIAESGNGLPTPYTSKLPLRSITRNACTVAEQRKNKKVWMPTAPTSRSLVESAMAPIMCHEVEKCIQGAVMGNYASLSKIILLRFIPSCSICPFCPHSVQ